MNFFKNHRNTQVTTVIKYLFLGILLMFISAIFISDIVRLIFMAIKNTTGHCTPFMAETIEKICDINTSALKMWAEDC